MCLLNYARGRTGEPISVAPADQFSTAIATSLDHPKGEMLKVAARPERFAEIPVPAFTVFSAIDLGQ